MNDFSLQGKVAVITGGSRGIGKAIALSYAHAGADVVVCSRTKGDELNSVAREITGLGRRALAVKADISEKVAVDGLVQSTLSEFGRIDVFVNNAGTTLYHTLIDTSEEEWDAVLNTNLRGCYFCSKAAAQVMVKQKKGSIISISSIRGMQPYTERAAYCVSKAGVIMLTRVMALELAASNVRANAIAPGLIKTELTKSLWTNQKTLEELKSEIPMGRWGNAEEVADVALFLASDASSYVTGQTIVVAGGSVI